VKRGLTKRWSEDGCLSQFVLTHALRQASVSLIFDVRQKKMPRYLLIILCLLFAGCITRTLSSPQLDARVAKHAHETVNWLDYMGTQNGFHYIRHSYTLGARTYRIPVEQMHVSDPFPVNPDRRAWRPLKRHAERWPPGLLPAFELPPETQKK
jgi:hypothetical protein